MGQELVTAMDREMAALYGWSCVTRKLNYVGSYDNEMTALQNDHLVTATETEVADL